MTRKMKVMVRDVIWGEGEIIKNQFSIEIEVVFDYCRHICRASCTHLPPVKAFPQASLENPPTW